ncbi:Ig-like domain-containing protein, partial [Parabacteroides sp. OttesenSCG-928-K15]|nr:Ig-like domain-containing protein [Parabacteroides sp. OttesenSCG-928-K15]
MTNNRYIDRRAAAKPLLFLLFILLASGLTAQNESKDFSTQGTEFYLTVGQTGWVEKPEGSYAGQYVYSANGMQLKIAAEETAIVTLYFTENSALNTSFPVPGGTLYTHEFSDSQKNAIYLARSSSISTFPTSDEYTAKVNKSLYITSTKPVSVYVSSSASGESDATNVLPLKSVGSSYYHISYPSTSIDGTYEFARYDGYAIVAIEDGTTVKDKDDNIIVDNLAKGQVYYSYSGYGKTEPSLTDGYTGMLLKSDKRFAYFVINTGTRIPVKIEATDNLFQQMMPVSTWGRRFAVPVTSRKKEHIRIMASLPNTTFWITGSSSKIHGGTVNGNGSVTIANAGDFVEYAITGDISEDVTAGCFIEADKPIAVCAFLVGNTELSETLKGDPAMTWIPAVEQKVKSSIVGVFNIKYGYNPAKNLSHHLLIITNTDAKTKTTISIGAGADKALSNGSWHDLPTGNQSYYHYPIDSTNISQSFTLKNSEGLTVLGYGIGGSQGYYYLAGAAARRINPHFLVDDIHHEEIYGQSFCKNTFQIKASISSRSTTVNPYLKWYVSHEGGSYVPQTSYNNNEGPFNLTLQPGWNKIKMEVTNYMNTLDVRETEIFVNSVTIDTPAQTNLRVGESITLTGRGYPTYLSGTWSSSNPSALSVNASSGLVTANGVGSATITYTHNGCSASIVLTADAVRNLWIGGQGMGYPNTGVTDANSWSVPANWTLNELPGENDVVMFHPNALDLHVDGHYKAVAIDASNSQYYRGVRVLAEQKLVLTDATTPLRSVSQLYIEAGDPFEEKANGAFISQPGITIPAVVQMKSSARNLKNAQNKYDPDLLKWQYFGIPVKSMTAALFDGAITRYHSESATDGRYWQAMTKSTTMLPGKGYELAWFTTNMSDKTKGIFEFYGDLVNTNQTMSLSRTANNLFSGQHVVSNPYTAGLNIKSGLGFTPNMEKTVYLFHAGTSKEWDEWAAGARGDGSGPGQYIAVPQLQAGGGLYLPETISSMQGFVVKVNSGTTAILGFLYSKVQENNNYLRSFSAEEKEKVCTVVSLTAEDCLKDRLWLFTDADATRRFDNGYDGRKLIASSYPAQLYAVEEDGDYQVNTLPDIHNSYLAFKAEEGVKQYTLTFEHQSTAAHYGKIYLVDLAEDNRHLIDVTAEGAVYTFTAHNTQTAERRFKIVTEANATDIDALNSCHFDIRFLQEEVVLSNCAETADVSLYTINGTKVWQTQLQPYQ